MLILILYQADFFIDFYLLPYDFVYLFFIFSLEDDDSYFLYDILEIDVILYGYL